MAGNDAVLLAQADSTAKTAVAKPPADTGAKPPPAEQTKPLTDSGAKPVPAEQAKPPADSGAKPLPAEQVKPPANSVTRPISTAQAKPEAKTGMQAEKSLPAGLARIRLRR